MRFSVCIQLYDTYIMSTICMRSKSGLVAEHLVGFLSAKVFNKFLRLLGCLTDVSVGSWLNCNNYLSSKLRRLRLPSRLSRIHTHTISLWLSLAYARVNVPDTTNISLTPIKQFLQMAIYFSSHHRIERYLQAICICFLHRPVSIWKQ